MLEKIVYFHRWWAQVQEGDNNFKVYNDIKNSFEVDFILTTNLEEGCGYDNIDDVKRCIDRFFRPTSKKEKETVNLLMCHNYILDEVKGNKELHGLLELNLVKYAHGLIFKDIEFSSKPRVGEFSNKVRATCFKGEKYVYAEPEGLAKKVQTLLDRHNDLIYYVQMEGDLKKKLDNLYKICAVFLFEFLDLHPFFDGNGRLSRLLCNYVLLSVNPFSVSICGDGKDDYVQSLIDARNSSDRYPAGLTALIIKSNYYAWERFFNLFNQGI
jgi:Fic family protein